MDVPIFYYLQQINFYHDLQLLHNENLVYISFIQQWVLEIFH